MNDSTKVFTSLGASNHSIGTRQEDDYYATEPRAVELLMELEQFNINIWECASGENHLAIPLQKAGPKQISSRLGGFYQSGDGEIGGPAICPAVEILYLV